MKTGKRKILTLVALALILCVSLSACLSIVGNIIDNLESVFNFVQSFGEDKLPENTVYGSANPLTVGFFDGKLTAYWDAEDNVKGTVSVTADNITTDYSDDKYADLYDGNRFDLSGAGYTYDEKFSVAVKKTNLKNNTYTLAEANYNGITADEYLTYTKNVGSGFTDIDFYIANRYELFEFFNYMLVFRPGATEVAEKNDSYIKVMTEFKIAYDFTSLYDSSVSRDKAYEAEIMCAVASFEDSAAYRYAYMLEGDKGTVLIKYYYGDVPVYSSNSNTMYTNATSVGDRAHYSLEYKERSFPIDDLSNGVTVTSSDQLYFAIKKGYKPLPVAGSNADLLYQRMRYILSEINSNSTVIPSKVHNIYDYLVNTVVYDYEYVDVILKDESANDADFFLYKCLYLEGVFGLTENGTFSEGQCVAICDGLSKAFLCMAKIEGIDCLKISGTSDGSAHAWNKVQVNSRWYLVDITWGNSLDRSNREYLNHNYLMVADDDKHIEDKWFAYPKATGRYNFIFG